MTPRVWIFAIVRAMITLGCMSSLIYQEVVIGNEASTFLQQIVTLIVGFYFGAEATSAVSDNRNKDK